MLDKHLYYHEPEPGQLWNVDTDYNTTFGQKQLQETMRPLPVLVLFHFIAALTIHAIAFETVSTLALATWQLSVLIAGAAFLTIYFRWNSSSPKTAGHHIFSNQILVAAVFLAFVWSVPPIIFHKEASEGSNFIMLGIVLAMMSVGIVTFLRVPASAITYAAFLSVVISRSVYLNLSNHKLTGAVICLLFGTALVAIIVVLHQEFRRTVEIENAQRKQNQTIKLLLNDFERETSNWLWETNQRGELTYHSQSLNCFLGVANISRLGQNLLEILEPAFESKSFGELADQITAHGDIVNLVVTSTLNDRQHYWQISARAKFYDDGTFQGHDGVSRDITQQQISAMEVRAAKEVAEQASSAKSQFLAVISHELRTPINAIVGFSEVLNDSQSESISTFNRKAYLDTILESAKQLQGLINDILDATRVERGALHMTDQDIDAAELIEASTKICRDQATKSDISIVARVQEDINLTGDLTRLKQVLVNLLTNAIKFSPPKTIINIDMKRGRDDQLIIAIRDAGIGISAADAERVFEPFVQLDEGNTRRFGGIGLGLSIARRIARLHGGDVTLKGSEGIGTEACLTIPAARLRWPGSRSKKATQSDVAA